MSSVCRSPADLSVAELIRVSVKGLDLGLGTEIKSVVIRRRESRNPQLVSRKGDLRGTWPGGGVERAVSCSLAMPLLTLLNGKLEVISDNDPETISGVIQLTIPSC